MWCTKIILHINLKINKNQTNKKKRGRDWRKIEIQLINEKIIFKEKIKTQLIRRDIRKKNHEKWKIKLIKIQKKWDLKEKKNIT